MGLAYQSKEFGLVFISVVYFYFKNSQLPDLNCKALWRWEESVVGWKK
jgi:hypothetical protein